MRLNEFAPAGGGGSGDYFQALASAWYNGVFDTGSLPRGIKTQEDVERLLNRGIVAPDGKMRKYHIDYNSDFDGVEIYSDDYYEHGDHDATIDSRTGQKWGPYDFMAFSDDELNEGSDDPFGPEGRYVGDTGPKQISTTVPRVKLQVGDRVVYRPTEQRARIVALSQDGSQARIDMPSPMGGRVFNCKTSDLKSLGR